MDAFSGCRARPPIHLVDVESDLVGDLALRAEHQHPVVAAMLLTEIDRAELHSRSNLPEGVVTLGAEVDFVDNVTGGGFTIKNPNAKSTCGCGSSFSV